VEIGEVIDFPEGHVLHTPVTKQFVQDFFLHVGRVQELLELENTHGKRLCFGPIPPLRPEDVAEKNEIFRFFFGVKPDLDLPMGFQRKTACDDEDLSIRLEQVVDLSNDVVGIALKLPFGNDPLRLWAESFRENEFVKLPRQNDQIQRALEGRELSERVQNNELMFFEPEGEFGDEQVVRVREEPDSQAFRQGLLPVGLDDDGDLIRLAPDGGERTRHVVDRDQIIGLAETGKTDEQAHTLIKLVDLLVGSPGVSGFIRGNGLKKSLVPRAEAVIDFKESETVGVPSETAQQPRRMFVGWKSAGRDVRGIDTERLKVLDLDEAERVFFQKTFLKNGIAGDHLNFTARPHRGS